MVDLPGIRIIEQIGCNEEIVLYRALRLKDNVSVIAKTASDSYTGSGMTDDFQYEYDRLLELKGTEAALEPLGLDIVLDRPVLLLREARTGTTLDQALRSRRASLKFPELLEAAIAITDSLRRLHLAGLTLNEISPLHLWINEQWTEAKWIDIRACSAEKEDDRMTRAGGKADSVLPYLSPERTGRTGMVPDYRSDFYSLGVILYEWFAGSLPFQTSGALDIVYHHLAAAPEPLHRINPSIPGIVSDIVGKCMEKMPEARYASALGIKADLEECRVQLRVFGKIQPFRLAKGDVSEKWLESDKLFGKEAERQVLLQAAERVAEEAVAETVWISGEAGVGKTSLALAALRQAVPAEGFFARGRFELSALEQPYGIWIQAMDDLVGQLLTVDQAQAEVWKIRIVEAVQGGGQLLIDRVPRLKWLIGEQPAVGDQPPAGAKSWFQLAMNRFFQLFAERERPLVLFFDHLHLAEEASIRYLFHLLEDKQTRHLLIVGAYRENEGYSPDFSERLAKRLADIGTRTATIRLGAYTLADMKEVVRLFPIAPAEGADELAELLLHKTEGNPAFLNRFLRDIIGRRLVAFDERSGGWQWNLRLIAELNVSETAAASIADTLNRLRSDTVDVLARAAFLGKRFDLDTLGLVTGFAMDRLDRAIDEAVGSRLLQLTDRERSDYVFQHEYIREAACELLPREERTNLHATIGFLWAERFKEGDASLLFAALSHLNQAAELIVVQGRRLELAELNLQASLQAKQSSAFETALAYLRRAAELLEEGDWKSSYSLAYQISKERAEAEFLCANFAESEQLFQLLMAKAATDLDKAQACVMMMQLKHERPQEVISLGETALKLLGIRSSFSPGAAELVLQWVRVRRKLRKHPVESIGSLPPMTDERYRTAMGVLGHTSAASIDLYKKSWVFSILKMLEITIEYGLTPEASIAFSGYAVILNYKFHQYEEAYRWGKLACDISAAKPRLHMQALVSLSLCYDSWSRYEPDFLSTNGDELTDGIYAKIGYLWQANQSALIHCGLRLQFGYPLRDIYERLLSHSEELMRDPDSSHAKHASAFAWLISSLTGYRAPNDPFREADAETESSVADDEFDEQKLLLQEYVNVSQYVAGYLFGDYDKARRALDRSVKGTQIVERPFDPQSYYYYRVLVLKELYDTAARREKNRHMRQIRFCIRKLKAMAGRSPENYAHKYLLAKAEEAGLSGEDGKAERLYQQALDAARARGFSHDVGIIAECFARYGLRRGKPWLANPYMNEAYEAYTSWGALRKAADLEEKFGHLLPSKRKAETGLEKIDYLSVALSAQALSGEMDMDRLLHMLMRIMLQNAGAEYGALIFEEEGRWTVEAYGTADKIGKGPVPLEQAESLVPTAVIGYAARTREELVLRSVANGSIFSRGEYMKSNEPKSVLCLPILYQSKLLCLIYMDNKLASGVFTEERLDVLKLLCSQCAISITNAKLYSTTQYWKNHLEEQVAERTHARKIHEGDVRGVGGSDCLRGTESNRAGNPRYRRAFAYFDDFADRSGKEAAAKG